MGPTVWELDGPMPTLKRSRVLIDIYKRGMARAVKEWTVKKNLALRDLSGEDSADFYCALGPADVCKTLSEVLWLGHLSHPTIIAAVCSGVFYGG